MITFPFFDISSWLSLAFFFLGRVYFTPMHEINEMQQTSITQHLISALIFILKLVIFKRMARKHI